MRHSKTKINHSNKKFNGNININFNKLKMLRIINKNNIIAANLLKVNLYLNARKKMKLYKDKKKTLNKDGRTKAKTHKIKCCLKKYNKYRVKKMFAKIHCSKNWKNSKQSMMNRKKLTKQTMLMKSKVNKFIMRTSTARKKWWDHKRHKRFATFNQNRHKNQTV